MSHDHGVAEVMTRQEAARRLGVTERTVHNLMASGRLQRVERGTRADGRARSVLVTTASVEAEIASRTRTVAVEPPKAAEVAA